MTQRNNLAKFYKRLKKEIDKYLFVLSTEVFIEGVLNAESCSGRLIDYLIDGRYDIALDDRIYLEYFTEIHSKKIEKKNIDYLFAFLKEYGKFVTAKKIHTHGTTFRVENSFDKYFRAQHEKIFIYFFFEAFIKFG